MLFWSLETQGSPSGTKSSKKEENIIQEEFSISLDNNCFRKAFRNKQKVFRGWKNPDMSGNVGTGRICQLFKFGCKLQSI